MGSCSGLLLVEFDRIKDARGRPLDVFQTLEKEFRVPAVHRHVVRSGGAGFQADGLANDKGDRFCLGLADALGCSCAPL